MSFAIKNGVGWRELVPGEPVVIEEVASSWDTVISWTPQYRSGQGIRVVVETPIPDGKVSAASRIENQDGKPVRVHDLVDAPPLVETFPAISDRQFFEALASSPYNLITPQEALDAVKTGEIPAVMQTVIDQLPPDKQFPVTMLVAGATNFERDNIFVPIFAASQNMDAAAVNAFWRFAEGL